MTISNAKLNNYAQAALDKEVERVASALKGERNKTENSAGFALAPFVRDGLLDRQTVIDRLEQGSEFNGRAQEDGRPAVRASITGGLDAGLRKNGRILGVERALAGDGSASGTEESHFDQWKRKPAQACQCALN